MSAQARLPCNASASYNDCMSVRLRLFSSMRSAVGRAEIPWDEPVRDAQQLWEALEQRYPQLKPLSASRVVAVNRKHVPLNHPLCSGDEVAFFPPVSGG